ncbi:MAG: hypothetical protein ACKO1Y_04755 [Actinomycetota bacterium]
MTETPRPDGMTPRREPSVVAFGSLGTRPPALPWWKIRRAELRGVEYPPEPDRPGVPPAATPEPDPSRAVEPAHGPNPVIDGAQADLARTPLAVAGLLVGIVVVVAHFAVVPWLSRSLVAAAGILGAIGFGHWLQARHPDEPWLARFLAWGAIVKVLASLLRYRTLVDAYGAVGDATIYDTWGRRFANVWLNVPGAEIGVLPDLRKSNFVRWFTGVVYYLFGRDIITGFLVFGLIALVGSYLWYRAGCLAVPFLDRRLFMILMLFAPSLAFWPSSVGKEALMQFGLGAIALGTAYVLRGRLLHGLLVAFPGAWLVWVVRAHLLGIAVLAAALAYIIGRSGRRATTEGSLFKPIGMILVALIAVFAVSQGAKALGVDALSLDSIQSELEATQTSTSQGGSKFESSVSLSPLQLPAAAVTVLIRPVPWEVETPNQILASIEGLALVGFMVYRRHSLAMSLRRLRVQPFLLYCWTLTITYVMLFQAFGNFGLLVRQRSIVLPALYLLLCLRTEPAAVPEPAVGGITASGV